jgi:hypothetical protein
VASLLSQFLFTRVGGFCSRWLAGEDNFSKCVGFGNGGVLADNDPLEQEKAAQFNALLAIAIFSELGPSFRPCWGPVLDLRSEGSSSAGSKRNPASRSSHLCRVTAMSWSGARGRL